MTNKNPIKTSTETYSINKLISDLKWLERGLNGRNEGFLFGLQKFRQELEAAPSSFTVTSASARKTKGKTSILHLFCTIFDPIIEREVFARLNNNETNLRDLLGTSLRSSLKNRNNCRQLANNLKEGIQYVENHSVMFSDLHEATKVGDGLQCLATLLDRISSVFPKGLIKWCRFCFRRAPDRGEYCKVHKPGGDDTAYRKGNKISQLIPIEIKDRWNQQRFLRTINATPMYSLDAYTTPWDTAALYWDELLMDYKKVAQMLKKPSSSFISWTDFVLHLRNTLSNDYEKTENPYWILILIQDAEDWLCKEDGHVDLRKTSSSQEILDIFDSVNQNNDNRTNLAEIARSVKKSRQYVSKVLKENRRLQS